MAEAEADLRVASRPCGEFDAAVDVVIVGAGAAGLVAALAAHERGASVMVVERDASPSGSTSLSAGLVPACATRWQHNAGIKDSPALFTSDIIAKSGHEPDRDLACVLAAQSGDVLHWLHDAWGIPFSLVEGFVYPGHSVRRMHGTPLRTGSELVGSLLRAVGETSVDIVTSARVTQLYQHDGEMTGIAFTRPDGAIQALGAGQVVLACNGYGANRAMVEKFLPAMADALYFGHPGNTGDAVAWGEQLGAATRHLSAYQGHGSVATPHGILITWAVMMEGGIQVNADGMRFSNEHAGYSEQAVHVLAQPGGVGINIFDQRIFDIAAQFEDFRDADAAGAILRAADVAELAAVTGTPVDTLGRSMEQARDLARNAQTDCFGRQFRAEHELTPPYCAVRVEGALFHTQGGLDIDHSARVLRVDGTTIPGLFATGGAARGVSGTSVEGYLSGNGLLSAVVLGAIAGRESVDNA